jgi:S1-C subfamily serine protease
LEDLVQTDAAINNGDSGGALVNLEGEVIGLLTTVVREGPGGVQIEGVTFAQSSNSLRAAVEDIVARGFHPRARLGIERVSQHAEITPEVAEAQGFPVPVGAFVRAVAPGSPAAGAGIQPGDIVVGLNGVAVDLENPLVNLLKRLETGAPAELAVLRGTEQLVFDVTPNYSDVPW